MARMRIPSLAALLRFLRKKADDPRTVPFQTLIKGTALIMTAPLMLLTLYTLYGRLDIMEALAGVAFIFVISIIFVRPYIANVSALTYYVEQLSLDKKAEVPDLSFLNNVEQIAEAVSRLHKTWNRRKKQLEAMVAESKILIDTLPDILIMLDENLHTVRTNSTAHLVFGGRYFKENLEKIIHDPVVEKTIHKVMEDKVGRGMEYSVAEPRPKDFIMRIERFPAPSLGGIAIVIAMHDVTEQKHTEKMLADFVANASHEIRTPLTSLMGFIETIQTTAKDDPKAQEEFLKIMDQQAKRMSKLVKDLLSLSHIEMNLNTRPTGSASITEILSEVKTQCEWELSEKGMTLVMDVEENIPKTLGDTDELIQVFGNLVSNSIKYGHKDSTITLRACLTDNIYPEDKILREADKIISVAVADESEGIAPEHLPRLTERFYRVDTARSRKIGGTGLGLAIVKHILERHNGTLKIESTVNKGSVFTVLIPVQ